MQWVVKMLMYLPQDTGHAESFYGLKASLDKLMQLKKHCRRLNRDVSSGTGLGNKFPVGQEVTTLLSSFNFLYLQISISSHCLSWDISPFSVMTHLSIIILCFFYLLFLFAIIFLEKSGMLM